jgi:hypothetical protein
LNFDLSIGVSSSKGTQSFSFLMKNSIFLNNIFVIPIQDPKHYKIKKEIGFLIQLQLSSPYLWGGGVGTDIHMYGMNIHM